MKKKPTPTLADLRRALAEQNAQLRAAFAALDPDRPVAVSAATLAEVEERTSQRPASSSGPAPLEWSAIRG